MSVLDVTIPQMGEGLQEARLVRFLKQPGDAILRDEPIFEMETDKATMEIEAPVSGVLVEWLAPEDTVIPIGAAVGRIDTPDVTELPPPAVVLPASPPVSAATPVRTASPVRNAVIPPRTRAYARECGLADHDIEELLAAATGKVMPADVDRWMAAREAASRGDQAGDYEDIAMSNAQRTLVYRLQQRAGEVIAATEEIEVAWGPIDAVRRDLKATARQAGIGPATPFLIFAWCVVRASLKHPVFRSTYQGAGTVRRHAHLHLGIAVAREDDELTTARVEEADALGFADFVRSATDAIRRARNGEDQASALMQLSLSNLTGMGVTRAIPVVAGPAVGTIFVGAVRETPEIRQGELRVRRVATVCLTFDHRMTNGVGAARFLAEIRSTVGSLTAEALKDETRT
ncbi:MAG: hypothetical protein FJX72_08900 [Armatimonadetes bacterium]|nr:hypothetical protein [Armatimonadota bacterium]